jgi:type VI secretion system protein ImpL
MLNLSCADGQTRLKNYNFRETRPFAWQMNQCGDVELTILLPDTKLTYRYSGEMGFARFLRDFRDGVRNFTPEDFPEQSRLLKNWGISSIRVAYEIRGADPVIRLLTDVPRKVPETIIAKRLH